MCKEIIHCEPESASVTMRTIFFEFLKVSLFENKTDIQPAADSSGFFNPNPNCYQKRNWVSNNKVIYGILKTVRGFCSGVLDKVCGTDSFVLAMSEHPWYHWTTIVTPPPPMRQIRPML